MADPTKEKFSRIKGLRCFAEVKEMILAGFPVAAVADFIQKDVREYEDVKRESLMWSLRKFRESFSEGEMVARTLPRVFAKAREKFSNRLEDLQRLEELYQLNKYRLAVAHGHERLSGKIDPKVDRMIRGQREIIAKMHTLKQDLGLTGTREHGSVSVDPEKLEKVREKWGEGAAKAFANPVSRNRVLAAFAAIKRVGGLMDKDGNPRSGTEEVHVDDPEEKESIDSELQSA